MGAGRGDPGSLSPHKSSHSLLLLGMNFDCFRTGHLNVLFEIGFKQKQIVISFSSPVSLASQLDAAWSESQTQNEVYVWSIWNWFPSQ